MKISIIWFSVTSKRIIKIENLVMNISKMNAYKLLFIFFLLSCGRRNCPKFDYLNFNINPNSIDKNLLFFNEGRYIKFDLLTRRHHNGNLNYAAY